MATSTEQLAAGVLLALAGKRDRRIPKIADDAHWRGRVDARALRVRFSDPSIHGELLALAGRNSGLFELLEQARVEAKVPSAWSGVRANLAALRAIRDPLPHWEGRAGWEHLADLVDDQRAFGVEALRLIGDFPAAAASASAESFRHRSSGARAKPHDPSRRFAPGARNPEGHDRRAFVPCSRRRSRLSRFHRTVRYSSRRSHRFANQLRATLWPSSCAAFVATRLPTSRVGRVDYSAIFRFNRRASGSSTAKRGCSIARGSHE